MFRLNKLLAQYVLGRFASQAFMSTHATFLESLVVRRDPSSLICDRKAHPISLKFLSSVLEPERELKRISILIPIPCLYLTASTNQSPFCNWKRQQLARLEDSRLNCRRNTIYGGADGGKKRAAISPPHRCNFDIPSLSEGKYANDL